MTEEIDNENYFNPEEEIKITPTKPCSLPKVEIRTGEEDEDIIYKCKGKLYRFRDEEWKERARGCIKLLRHKTNKKIRLIMRQDRTLTIAANFIISDIPLCELKPHKGSDRKFKIIAYDCSEEEPHLENFAIKLENVDKAQEFKKFFEEAQIFNRLVKEGKNSELKYAPIFKDEENENIKTDSKKE